eukprot:m.279652 g.279652  ORF g.279652 m.279652 type:complete len:538 (-) comp15745_c0_seq9:1805-3418(-)
MTETLSADLLCAVAAHLPLTDAIQLSLASKWLYSIVPFHIHNVWVDDNNARSTANTHRVPPEALSCPQAQRLHHWSLHGVVWELNTREDCQNILLPAKSTAHFLAVSITNPEILDVCVECLGTPTFSVLVCNAPSVFRAAIQHIAKGNLTITHLIDPVRSINTSDLGLLLACKGQEQVQVPSLRLRFTPGVGKCIDPTLLGEVLTQQLPVEKIQLRAAGIRDEGIEILCTGLKASSHLRELSVSTNHLTDVGVAKLTRALGASTSLRKLFFGDNPITERGVESLCALATQVQSLDTLSFLFCKLTDAGFRQLGNLLKDNNTLLHISFGATKLNTDGMRFIAAGLKQNKTLESINLWGNALSAEAAADLAQALESGCSNLTAIMLGHCSLNTEGLCSIIRSLPHTRIKKLWFDDNAFSEEAMRALVDVLPNVQDLTMLSLHNTGITNDLLSILTEGLMHNNSVALLELSQNPFTNSKPLVQLLEHNNSIYRVDVRHVNIPNFWTELGANQRTSHLRAVTTKVPLEGKNLPPFLSVEVK